MTDFPLHDLSSAPEASKPLLEKAGAAFGMIPNVLAVMAESPALLEGYMALGGIFAKSSLSPIEQQAVLLSVSFENRCAYCMAAHSTLAASLNMPEPVLDALRRGIPPPDARIEALASFAKTVVRERGWVGEKEIADFLAAGFERRHVLDVVLAAAFKTISNYANHMAHTALDAAFAPRAWEAPGG
ncbi:MAG: carboxymuconolactone decarboxylase family protein [Planctomycetota bacterium]